MNQEVKRYIKRNLPKDTSIINRLFVSSFLLTNKIEKANDFISHFIITKDNYPADYLKLSLFLSVIRKNYNVLSFEDLIEFFELVISPAEKEVNGAVYTPYYIRNCIIKGALSKFSDNKLLNIKIADLSCGCGGFFITAAQYIHERTGAKMSDIIRNFYGVDIANYSIERTQILLNILCIVHSELDVVSTNLYLQNSLAFDYKSIPEIKKNQGFDVIIGNPPYVSSSKITNESKILLKNWSVTSTGKTDLYLPFFQVAIESLKSNGVLGYITVNNFIRSLNGRAFRNYMSSNLYDIQIIDFGAEQVFKGRSTYTCICYIRKAKGLISYCKKRSKEILKIQEQDFVSLDYANVDDFSGWTLCKDDVRLILRKIATIGQKLCELFPIKNGFATLKNDVYLFSPVRETENSYFFMDGSKEVEIEKEICRFAVKPNILKQDSDVEENIECLIFPYVISSNNTASIIKESEMKKRFPKALEYLGHHFDELSHRDKETREYPTWYAYGRTQALNITGNKLLFPYLADNPYFVLTDKQQLLFYNGYAIISDSKRELKILQRILQSSVFWYYIKNTSKPYGGEYFSLAKNYVKDFGIPKLSEEEQAKILSLQGPQLDSYIEKIYGVNLPKD